MVWAFVIIVVLLIPVLAIVIDSQIGQALADRISGRDRTPHGSLHGKVDALEADVRYLTESMESLREETVFLRSLLEGRDEERSLPPGAGDSGPGSGERAPPASDTPEPER